MVKKLNLTLKKLQCLTTIFHHVWTVQHLPLPSGGYTLPVSLNDCPENLLCSQEKIFELLMSLDISKSNDPDGISARMLKATAGSIVQ